MIKLFSYTYEYVNMFIRINNQTFIFQKYLSIVSFRAGKLFTFFALYENIMFTLCK